jgi:predicted DNA-binding transcriptional regulator YafY
MKLTQDRLALTVAFEPGQTISFGYTNWQGRTGIRTACVIRLVYGSTEWHPEPQWLLEAMDTERNVVRLFALRDIKPPD